MGTLYLHQPLNKSNPMKEVWKQNNDYPQKIYDYLIDPEFREYLKLIYQGASGNKKRFVDDIQELVWIVNEYFDILYMVGRMEYELEYPKSVQPIRSTNTLDYWTTKCLKIIKKEGFVLDTAIKKVLEMSDFVNSGISESALADGMMKAFEAERKEIVNAFRKKLAQIRSEGNEPIT